MPKTDDLEKVVKFTPSVIDGATVNDSILRGIADAETVDDVFGDGKSGTLKLQDIEGEYVTIDAVRFHESSDQYKDGGWGIFAVIELAGGRIVTTGSKTVVLKLYKLSELSGFPLGYDVVFKSSLTKSGNTAWDVDKDRR